MWFVVRGKSAEFRGGTAFTSLLLACKQHASATALIPFNDMSQLLMSLNGLTSAGYRWEASAFQQFCNTLGGGLFAALSSLWKAGQYLDDKDRKQSFLKLYHNALRLGFREVQGVRLVVDKSQMLIVGVVGRSYKFVSNYDLLSMLTRSFSERGDYVSSYGSIKNRDICLIGVCKSVVRRLDSVSFRQGVGVFNSETTRQAIYVPRLVFDSVSASYSIEPPRNDNRLIHRKKKGFAESLDGVVSGAFVSVDRLDDVVDGFGKLRRRSLWTSTDARAKVVRQLLDGLGDIEVGVFAQNSVRSSLEGRTTATLWDFYQSLVMTASAGKSERTLRTCAFKLLLTGSLK